MGRRWPFTEQCGAGPRCISALRFRAIFCLPGYFGLVGYRATGLWTPSVTRLYLISLPAILPAIFLGRALNRRLHPEAFLRYVYVGLALIACLLFVQAMHGA